MANNERDGLLMKTATRGAGKPALYGKAMKRINVTLDEETIKFHIEQGKGNLSKGIRQHWRSLTKRAADGAEGCWLCGKPESDHPSVECMSFIRPAANA
jgi:hypothetical protein